jgi:hypothetical protein
MTKLFILLACGFLATGAAAQTVYKCTTAGKVSYGERPCADGKTTILAAPAAGDTAAAEAAAERDKTALNTIEKAHAADDERAGRERTRAARAADIRRQKCERLRLKRQWAEQDAARTTGQARDTAQLKAKRQGEALAVECPG